MHTLSVTSLMLIEKVLEWLSTDSPKGANTTNQGLSSAAKIVKVQ